jgi:hypothetical protein
MNVEEKLDEYACGLAGYGRLQLMPLLSQHRHCFDSSRTGHALYQYPKSIDVHDGLCCTQDCCSWAQGLLNHPTAMHAVDPPHNNLVTGAPAYMYTLWCLQL